MMKHDHLLEDRDTCEGYEDIRNIIVSGDLYESAGYQEIGSGPEQKIPAYGIPNDSQGHLQ